MEGKSESFDECYSDEDRFNSLIVSEITEINQPITLDGGHHILTINIDESLLQINSLDLPKQIKLKFTYGTELDLVGEQLWAGALILSDFVLHNNSEFKGETVFELGSGLGLLGLIISFIKASKVYCTDYLKEVLTICQYNVLQLNEGDSYRFEFKRVDWMEAKLMDGGEGTGIIDEFSWDQQETIKSCKDIKYFFAADVVYDNPLTKGFLNTVLNLLQCSTRESPTLFLSIEKRINFCLNKLKVVAEAYDYLFELANQEPYCSKLKFEKVAIDFPKFINNYERTEQLEIWKFILK
ncbi:hypothetical protein K502DRAFT_351045 [Neoconidiobolus thromboides FSU 785]|nr:hypothetical protein K502DRAFT_351045 [Neoconidiobolus thromboides FSU 785]